MNKRILALVLAFALVFSSFSAAFADTTTISADAAAAKALGMLVGNGTEGVTPAYLATTPTRLQSAIMFLRLNGLEEEAIAFTNANNFSDMKNYAWADGKNIGAYLKAHPELGFVGSNDGSFKPNEAINAQSYYKVLLETLGYKQTTSTVVGQYTWEQVIAFAATKGLSKVAAVTNYTVDNLATATIEALKAENGKLAQALIANGIITSAKAIEAGLITAPVVAKVDTVKAIGNTVVEVTFDADVNAAAANVANYTIAGLAVKSAVLAGNDVVRLTTDAMTAGKLYTLTVGNAAVKFTGIAKVSGAPVLGTVSSTDVEEVVVPFDKALDFATASNVANYTIAGVEVLSADVDGNTVTLTTKGLVAKKQYTVKVSNVKSIDGVVVAKNSSKSFYTRFDVAAPTVSSVTAETNERVVVLFNEEVSKASAENVANYVIKTGTTELAVIKATLVKNTADNDKLNKVELTTEAQKVNARYSIEISSISDATKAANTMTKAVTKYFYGKKVDETAPSVTAPVAISRNLIMVTFTDAMSKLDEATVLDVNNYNFAKGTETLAVEKVEKLSSKTGEYKVILTVDDMNVGTYSLEVSNIADEFGNVMNDKKQMFTVNKDSFASATVASKAVVDMNTITITFTKPVAKATAEDLANYTINKSIGAPTKAVYKNNTVTLSTIDLVKDQTYKLTLNGVKDLAGNTLSGSFEFTTTGVGSVDTTPAELVEIYAINQNVVAVAFDKAVKYTAGTTKLVLSNGITLDAKAMTEGNTVIEFSNISGNMTLNSTNEYKVQNGSLTGITNKVGNAEYVPVDFSLDENEYIVPGNDADVEVPEVLSIAQVDGVSFEVTMSKDVVATDATLPTGWTMTVDKDDKSLVTFTKSTAIADIEKYAFDLSTLLEDAHGVAAADLDGDTTFFFVEFQDTENPYIVNVVAKDRNTVEIEYSEAMKTAATYKIVNADDSIKTVYGYAIAEDGIDGKIITLDLTTALEGRYDYKLVVTNTAAKDLANNTAVEIANDEFYFNGTDIAPIQ